MDIVINELVTPDSIRSSNDDVVRMELYVNEAFTKIGESWYIGDRQINCDSNLHLLLDELLRNKLSKKREEINDETGV